MKELLEWLNKNSWVFDRPKIIVENNSLAWLGFWLALGMIITAAILKGQVILK